MINRRVWYQKKKGKEEEKKDNRRRDNNVATKSKMQSESKMVFKMRFTCLTKF